MNKRSKGFLTHTFMRGLLHEFCQTMRQLLVDVCEELETEYRPSSKRLGLPLPLFQLIRKALPHEAFSHWKVVGWIEDLNDLLFLVDLLEQAHRESGARLSGDFMEQAWDHCSQQYYEHAYLEELFPYGRQHDSGFTTRLTRLTTRLGQQVTQQSLFLVEGVVEEGLNIGRSSPSSIPLRLVPNFERGELGGCLYIGLHGGYIQPPASIRQGLAQGTTKVRLCISRGKLALAVGRQSFPLAFAKEKLANGWQVHPPCWVREPNGNGEMGLTLGSTLVYGKDRKPRRILRPRSEIVGRVKEALLHLDRVWPEGSQLVGLLTSRLIPIQATGVVSYSYRNYPGLSFINVFDRNQLDLIDDLVHENSHHHLNLLLRKFHLFAGDQNEEMFFSPWRRSLRPLRGIVHATFTFSMGAMLFAKIANVEATGRGGVGQGLSKRERLRSIARGLEEVSSVNYALQDLKGVAVRRGWMTASGQSLVRALQRLIAQASQLLRPQESTLKGTRFRTDLIHHRRELQEAEGLYQQRGRRSRWTPSH